jgi:hypothetical protein
MGFQIFLNKLDPAEKDGYMTKQGGSIKTWKRRWFVLKGPNLYYFKTNKVRLLSLILATERSNSTFFFGIRSAHFAAQILPPFQHLPPLPIRATMQFPSIFSMNLSAAPSDTPFCSARR